MNEPTIELRMLPDELAALLEMRAKLIDEQDARMRDLEQQLAHAESELAKYIKKYGAICPTCEGKGGFMGDDSIDCPDCKPLDGSQAVQTGSPRCAKPKASLEDGGKAVSS